MKTIPQAFKERHQEWIRVVNNGDIEGYSEILTKDAVWIPPRSEPIEGRDAFKNWLTPFVKEYSYQFEISEQRIHITGNRALERASFTSTMTPRSGGDSMTHSGTFTALWIKDKDNMWYIERYIDDTNL